MRVTYDVDYRARRGERGDGGLSGASPCATSTSRRSRPTARRPPTPPPREPMPQRSRQRSARYLERALKAGPSLTLDPIRFRYGGEPFDGRIEVTTNPERLPPAGTLSLDNPLMMLGLVDTKADVRLSKTLAGQLATLGARMQLGSDPTIPPDQLDYMAEAQSGLMLTMLVGQGVLIEDGEGYRTSVDYTDGTHDAERQPAAVRASVAQSSASGGSGAASSGGEPSPAASALGGLGRLVVLVRSRPSSFRWSFAPPRRPREARALRPRPPTSARTLRACT